MTRPPIRPSLIAAMILLVLSSRPGSACPICMGGTLREPSFATRLMEADLAVAATATDPGTFEVQRVLKGIGPRIGERIQSETVEPGVDVLFLRKERATEWEDAGRLNDRVRPFVEKMLPLQPLDLAPDRSWQKRLDLVLGDLGDPDGRIAESAWEIWASAPYRVLATRKKIPSLEQIRAWLADDSKPRTHGLWWTLLGLYGDKSDHQHISETLKTAWEENGTTSLSALMSASVAGQGAPAVEFIEQHYLLDEDRQLEEIQEAVLALGLHGAQSRELRPRIIQAFEAFAKQRSPLSGMVAQDMAAWGQWQLWPQYVELLRSDDPILPVTRPAILDYLRRCPDQEAKAAIKSLATPE